MTFEDAEEFVANSHGGLSRETVIKEYGYVSKWVKEAVELYAQSERARVWDECLASCIRFNFTNPYKS